MLRRNSLFSKMLLLAIFTSAPPCFAEFGSGSSTGGKGGPFIQLQNMSLANFDSQLSGTPFVLGGEGYAIIGKGIRLGGAGGGGFLWNPNQNTQLALGYGGILGEYAFGRWINVRLMIGGGGYAVNKAVSQSNEQILVERVASDGFLLVFPSVGTDFDIGKGVRLGLRLGYFLPNVDKLQCITLGFHLMFGRN